jgi:ClpP class serine protease/chaperonin cofactor prefoldin
VPRQTNRGNRLVQWGSGTAWYATPQSLGVMAAILFKAMKWEAPVFSSAVPVIKVEGEGEVLTFPVELPAAEAEHGFLAIMDDAAAKPQWEQGSGSRVKNGVATIPIMGPIFRHADMFTMMCGGATTESLMSSLRSAADDRTVQGIVLEIDSPGGEAAGIAEAALFISELSQTKPIVAYVDGDCCSAAYFLASAATEIVTAPSGVLGCIGTLMTIANPALKDSPPRAITIVSSQSPKKVPDAGTPEGLAQFQRFVDAQAQVFIDHVAMFRGVTPEHVAENFGQGDIFVGKDAVSAGLADSVGTYDSVVKGMLESFRAPSGSQGGRTMARSSLLEGLKALFMDPEVQAELGGDPVLATAGLPVHNPVEEAPAVAQEVEAVAEEVAAVPPAFQSEETRVVMAQLEESGRELEASRAALAAKETELQERLATVQAEAAAAKVEAIRAQALNWAKSEVLAGRADPAEQDDLQAQYLEALEDDQALGPRSSADGTLVTRVQSLQARQSKRPANAMTAELIAVVPDGAVAIGNKLETPKRGEGAEMTRDERRKALMVTEFGRAVLAKEDAEAALLAKSSH